MGEPGDKPDVNWQAAFNCLADLADAQPTPADYAVKFRQLHDMLVEGGADPTDVRDGLLAIAPVAGRPPISKKHLDLVTKLLPERPRRGRGRPKGALGSKAYDKRYAHYIDWFRTKALNPGLTKEQFAKEHLGITDKALAEDETYYRAKIDALLQDLKPARMKQLDAGQRKAIESIYPLVIRHSYQSLAQKWRDAKQHSPGLSKEDFLRDYLGRARDRELAAGQADMLSDHLRMLDHGERQLADREAGGEQSHASAPKSKRHRARRPR
jgi:hypothetical protein